jgi:FtsH-binding integral membrane protein
VTTQEALRLVGNGFLIYAAVVGLLSVVLHARVTWWATQMGRHLMVYMFMLDATLVLGVIRMVIGTHWWFEIIRMVAFIGVCLAMTQRVWLQVVAQREHKEGAVRGEEMGNR